MAGRGRPLSRGYFFLPSLPSGSRRAVGTNVQAGCSPLYSRFPGSGSGVLAQTTLRGLLPWGVGEGPLFQPTQSWRLCTAPCAAIQKSRSEAAIEEKTAKKAASLSGDASSSPRGSGATQQQLEAESGEVFVGLALPEPRPAHIPEVVWSGLKRRLHSRADNPVGIAAALLREFFQNADCGRPASLFDPSLPVACGGGPQGSAPSSGFLFLDALSPVVSARENFDSLLFEARHPSRSRSDSYYLDGCGALSPESLLLRTHATAHQARLLSLGVLRAVWAAGVARRDEVDKRHFPVFHQTDAFCVFEGEELDTLRLQHEALLKALALRRRLRESEALEALGTTTEETLQARQQQRAALAAQAEAAGLSLQKLEELSSFACFAAQNPHRSNAVVLHLQVTLERLLRFLFSQKTASQQPLVKSVAETEEGKESALRSPAPELRWLYEDSFFPFTKPSVELELLHDGQWLEVLGAGEIRREIIQRTATEAGGAVDPSAWAGAVRAYVKEEQRRQRAPPRAVTLDSRGWALGIGIERLCFLLFGVSDIRLLWSRDPRFTRQFADGRVKEFAPFSHMPPVFKDISFWTEPTPPGSGPGSSNLQAVAAAAQRGETKAFAALGFDLPRFFEICREEGGGWIEDIQTRDVYVHPKHGRVGLCFRLTFKSLERTLTHGEVNDRQRNILERLKREMCLEIR